MYISDLKLVNFRNYEDERISLAQGTNILVGGNAQGKTNLLEAVYYCSKGSSFKSNSDRPIIMRGKDGFILDAQIIRSNRRKLIHIESASEKIIEINGIQIDSLEDMKSQFELVYFLPDHLRIVKDGPSLRRELVDEAIANIRPSFKGLHNDYNKVLRQRNARLKQRSRYFKEEIRALTIQLASLGARLTLMRDAYIKDLAKISAEVHTYLTDGKEKLVLSYAPASQVRQEAGLIKDLEKLMMDRLEDDIERGFTSRGPHRDDLNIYIDGLDIKKYASQGQQRSAILSIKLAEIDIIIQATGYSPILLLDDVFSELDEDRRARLLERIQGVQALITTNDVNFNLAKNTTIYQVRGGKISQ